MENTINPNGNGKAGSVEMLSLEVTQKWVRQDIDACITFLNLLRRHPEVLDELAAMFYEKMKERTRDAELLEKQS